MKYRLRGGNAKNIQFIQSSVLNNPLILNLNNKCDFNTMRKLMNTYPMPPKENHHHAGNILFHSTWTARHLDKMWDNKDWIYNDVVKNIPPSYKSFSILAAFLHDIGKLDGKRDVKDFIKPLHPEEGYIYLTKKLKIILPFFSECIKNPKVDVSIYKIIGNLAIISRHHQDLGLIMQGKMTVSKFVESFFNSVSKFPSTLFSYSTDQIDSLFYILLLVSLADVKGARPIGRKYNYSWKMLKQKLSYKEKETSTTPWERYGYEIKGKTVLKKVIDIFNRMSKIYFNKEIKSLAFELKTNNMNLIPDGTTKKMNITYSVLPSGVFLYKSMNKKITNKDHTTFRRPSWFGSEKTADIYLYNPSWGGYEYQFMTNRPLNLIRLDDDKTISQLMEYLIKSNQPEYVNLLKIMTGVGIKNIEEQKKLYKEYLKDTKNSSFLKKNLNVDYSKNTITRLSFADVDARIMNEVICQMPFDGYIAKPLGHLHEEIALCKPWKTTKYVKLYKKFYKNKKICKFLAQNEICEDINPFKDMKYNFPVNKYKGFKNNNNVLMKDEEGNISMNLMNGGKNKKSKIRKHKGIIQSGKNKGKLKSGYKYSGKKSKKGLRLIIKNKK